MTGRFPLQIQGAVLRIPAIFPLSFPYGAFTLYGAAFQRTSGRRVGKDTGPSTPHPFQLFAERFSLPYAPFTRRYSGHRICFLFLRLLRCFNSARSPSFRNGPKPAIRIHRSRDQSLHAATPGLSQLATYFVGSRAKPSTKWVSVARPHRPLGPVVVSS